LNIELNRRVINELQDNFKNLFNQVPL
jgi:hypothetical protein